MVAASKEGASLDVSPDEDVASVVALEFAPEVVLELPLDSPAEPDPPDAPVVLLLAPEAPVAVLIGVLVEPCVVDEFAPVLVVPELPAEPVGVPLVLELVSRTVLCSGVV